MSALPDEIRCRWPHLLGPGVVAVSGGADSVALLRALSVWTAPLTVAHLNHRLRGVHSDADEQFVRELAISLQLSCRTIAIDVGEVARRQGANLEATARKVRYDWLAEVATATGAAWIATGHTADDQAETVLHRLLRGSGIQGLRGIAREREIRPGLRIVRPLLEYGRADVLTFLESLGQSWREDQSNNDPIYTRNRIRHELLPLLRSFNPAIHEVLGRLAHQASETHCEQVAAALKLLGEAELPRADDRLVFQTTRLETAAPHLVRAMFRCVWEREGWPRQDMTFAHWKRLVAVARGDESAVDFPGGINARRRGQILQLGKGQNTAVSAGIEME